MARILARPYTCIAVVILLIMGIGPSIRKSAPGFDETYLRAAKLLTHHGDIYKDAPADTYPPFSSLFFVPFTHVPVRAARALWYAISTLSLVYLIVRSWRLAGGACLEPIDPTHPPSKLEHGAFIVGCIVAIQFAFNALTHLQTDLLIAALLTMGCACVARSQFVRAGVWIGLAAAFKATPLLFAPYLLWRRKFASALLVVAVAIAANLLPNVFKPPGGGTWLGEWYGQFLRPMTQSNYMPGEWRNVLNNNQALAGAANRWMLSSWRDEAESTLASEYQNWSPDWARSLVTRAHPEWDAAKVASVASRQCVRGLFFLLCAMSVLPLGMALLRRGANSPEFTTRSEVKMLECGAILCLMLLLSPNSSRAHFCILFLPAFCIARLAFQPNGSWTLRMLLALAAISSTLSIHLRLATTHRSEQLLLWLGMVTLATYLLLLACCVAFSKELPQANKLRSPAAG